MRYIEDLCERKSVLKNIKSDIVDAYKTIVEAYRIGNKLLICGNGGSAADSAHITGELVKAFKKKREIDDKLEERLKVVIEDYMDKNSLSDTRYLLKEMKDMLEPGLPTIDLTAFNSASSAFGNDKDWLYAYANEVLALGKQNDVLLAISTSGNSKNIINAALVAKAQGLKVIALSGFNGGRLRDIADVNIIVPINETYLIQEEHISIYHAICLDIEEEFF